MNKVILFFISTGILLGSFSCTVSKPQTQASMTQFENYEVLIDPQIWSEQTSVMKEVADSQNLKLNQSLVLETVFLRSWSMSDGTVLTVSKLIPKKVEITGQLPELCSIYLKSIGEKIGKNNETRILEDNFKKGHFWALNARIGDDSLVRQIFLKGQGLSALMIDFFIKGTEITPEVTDSLATILQSVN